MNAGELESRYSLTLAGGKNGLDRTVSAGCCGDLLSEVLAKAPKACVWLTVHTHPRIIALAVLREMAAVVVTGGYMPDEETRMKADRENIPLFTSPETAFALAGRLHGDGIGKAP